MFIIMADTFKPHSGLSGMLVRVHAAKSTALTICADMNKLSAASISGPRLYYWVVSAPIGSSDLAVLQESVYKGN